MKGITRRSSAKSIKFKNIFAEKMRVGNFGQRRPTDLTEWHCDFHLGFLKIGFRINKYGKDDYGNRFLRN